jgi:hypothetical protein
MTNQCEREMLWAPGRDHAQNQRDWRAIRANLKKSRRKVAFAMPDAQREKCFGEPLR